LLRRFHTVQQNLSPVFTARSVKHGEKKSLNHDLALLANELSRQPAARSLLAASVFVSPSFREFQKKGICKNCFVWGDPLNFHSIFTSPKTSVELPFGENRHHRKSVYVEITLHCDRHTDGQTLMIGYSY